MNETEKRALTYAQTIKKFRKIQNMSQEDLSKSSGINISTIKKYETGYRLPKREQLEKIATALGINVNDFYDNSISTTGELLSILVSIEKQTDMEISGKKNKDGDYDPNTINISFTNKDVNALLAEYLSYKDKYKETEDESGELENLILTDTPIEKAAK
ncbi:MAG: helix-turn-helix transcriptional regulator [Eubacterium sp.]|nr:helix-turn-helix transcriptional regulator [Eubacterium sp.]